MKKKSFLVIAVLCLALLFTATIVACTGDGDTDETPGNTDVTPGGDDVTPGGDDVTPGGDDVTPGGDDVTPGGDDTGITPEGEFTFTDLGNDQWSVAKYNGNRAHVVIPSTYKGGAVVAIGDEAFGGDTPMNLKLKSVVIPDSVTTIGEYAFCYCMGLTSVEIPDSVTTIGEGAFGGCIGLTSITIGEYVTAIGEYAFVACYKLVEIYNKSNLNLTAGSEEYGWVGLYAKNIYTEENESKLSHTDDGYIFYYNGSDGYLMSYCGDETELTLPDSFTAYDGTTVSPYGIYQYAFSIYVFPNYDLTSVDIPDSVTEIGNSAFAYCTSLTSVTIGDSVTTIGGYAFSGCTGLASVVIPDSVTAIGNYAFDGCTGLASVVIPDSVTAIGDSAFAYCTSLTSVTIGDSVTTIECYAFSGCDNLQQINWDAVAVNDFDYYDDVFYNSGTANGMTVTFGDRVQRIPSHAFDNCASLTSVTIGDSVTTIGDSAFAYCDSLTSVTFKDANGWQVSLNESFDEYTPLPAESLADPAMVAQYLKDYSDYRYYIRKV